VKGLREGYNGTMPESNRVIVLGGGFGGVKCAQILRRRLGRDIEVVLFNQENHMVFHPLLAEVAGGSIEAVAAPLRQLLPLVRCRTETIEEVDPPRRIVRYRSFDERTRELAYDHLVLALGSVVNLGLVPGMADHSFPLKTVGDAVQLRAHVMQRLEQAEVCDDPELRRWLLSFVVVGGGFSGVEVAGEINDLARGSRKFFAQIAAADIQVTIIHSRDQILPEIGDSLREFARRKMEAAGIRVLLGARVAAATADGVVLKEGDPVRGGTVVCTIGNAASPVIERMDAAKERGRLETRPDMRLVGEDRVWAIGDCARIVNAHDQQPAPPTGQFAEREGRQVAENITRVLAGEATKPFSFKPLGQLCSIGHRSAVAELFGMRLSGCVAWFLWRSIYLLKLPSWSRRIKVGFDWAWELVFSRDLTHLRSDPTERVSRAYYQPGDVIFRQGDLGSSFFAIESGEVDVLREDAGVKRSIALLGPGDFFGEMALVLEAPRNATVRARTAVEVVILGQHVFRQISGSLSLWRDLIRDAMTERSRTDWTDLPEARAILQSIPVRQLMTPIDAVRRSAQDRLEDALRTFSEQRDYCCVVDDQERLLGVLTPFEVFRALEAGARGDTPLGELALPHPVSIGEEDDAFVAASTMRTHGARVLPVTAGPPGRTLRGMICASDLLSRVLRDLDRQAAPTSD
jgi:NADH dehydrogenase